MSTYIADRKHILYLVQSALSFAMTSRGPFRWGLKDETKPGQWRGEELPCGDFDRAAEVANMLWRENVASVSHRYPNESSATLPWPDDNGFVIEPREFSVFAPEPSLAQLFKAIDCYAYQSCEHPQWEASESFAFIQSLRGDAWRALPGYEDAEWGAPAKARKRKAA